MRSYEDFKKKYKSTQRPSYEDFKQTYKKNYTKNTDDEDSGISTYKPSSTTSSPTNTESSSTKPNNYSQPETLDYGWLTEGAETNEITATNRLAHYKNNQNRISEIDENLSWVGGSIIPNFIENWFLSDEDEALRDELESLKAENKKYETTQYATDKYYTPATEEFEQNAAYRNYTNASKEELWNYDASASEGSEALSNGGYFDEEGNIRNSKGEIVQSANAPVVQDKLGMFLSTSDEEITEAYNRLSATNGNYTDTWANLVQEGDVNAWKYLTDYEIKVYYDLYKREGQEAAYKFLEDMTKELTRRETKASEEAINNASVGEQIALNIASIPLNVVGGVTGLVDNVSNLIQGKGINPYSRAHSFSNTTDAIWSKTANDIDNLTGNVALPWVETSFGDVYQSIMSFGSSALASVIPGGHLILASGAAEREMKNLYERGATTGQMATGGILAGVAEALFEKWSIGELKSIKDLSQGAVKNKLGVFIKGLLMGGVEASEEMATETVNQITDALVMGSQSDWVDFNTFTKNVVNAGIGGFISGGIGGNIAASANYNDYKNKVVKPLGNAIKDAGQTRTLVDVAKNLGSDSKSAKSASKITDKSSAYAIGKLYGLTETEISKANRSDIVKSLERKGLNTKTATHVADLMLDAEGSSVFENSRGVTKEGKTYKDIIKNPNSTVGTRNESLNEILRGVAEHRAKAEISKGKTDTDFADNSGFALLSNEEISRRMSEDPTFAKDYNEWTRIDSSEGNSIPFVENSTESNFEASAEGKAINTKTGKAVNIAEVSSINGKTMMIKTDDGEIINAENISFASEEDAIIYASVLNMNVPAGIANALIKGYKGTNTNSAVDYVNGVEEAFKYGKYNYPMAEVASAPFASTLSAEQRETAYKLGKIYANEKAIEEQKAIVAKGKGVTQKKVGKVNYEADKLSLTDVQKSSVESLNVLAMALGKDINIFESYVDKNGRRVYKDANGKVKSAPNGFYNPNDGSIWIDLNAGNFGQGTMMYTVAHELTHFIKQWSPTKFKALANFLVEQYGEKGVAVDALVRRQMKKAKDNGRTISYDAAFEEMVADSMESMLTDGKVIRDLYKKDKGLFNKIKSWIDGVLRKLNSAYKDYEPESEEGKYVLEMKESFRGMQTLFTEALQDASSNYSNEDVKAQKNTTKNSGDKYSKRYEAAKENNQILGLLKKVEYGNFKANEKADLGVVPDNVAIEIERLTGINVDGFKMVIEARQLEHIIIDHGKNGKTDKSMSNNRDIAKMEYIINNYDDLRKSGKTQAYSYMKNGRNRTADTVLYEKQIGEKSYYVVQAVPDTKAKTLYVVSAFIGKSGYKKETSQLINAKSLDVTAKTGSVVVSNNIISNPTENVKGSTAEAQKNTTDEGGVKFALREYSQHQKDNWKISKRIVIYESETQFRDFINEALQNKQFDKKLYFGAIPTDLAALIKSKTGLDVEGFNCSLSAYEIRKIFDDHGDETKEALRGQRAITEDDIVNIPLVLQSPETIVRSEKDYMGKPVINITKHINGKMTIAAVVSDKHLDLFVQTAYVGIKKGNLVTPIAEQAAIHTPKASSDTVSNNIISNPTENVKGSTAEAQKNTTTKGDVQLQARKIYIDKYGYNQHNISRANKLGELVNAFYNALTAQEWRMFYDEITNNGYLATTTIGTVTPIVVNDKLVIAERLYMGKDAHDYVVTDAYKLFTDDGNTSTLTLLQDALNKGDVDYDTQRIFTFVNRLNRLDGRNELLARYNRNNARFDVTADNGKQEKGFSEIHRDSQKEITRERLSLRDKSNIQENDELLKNNDGSDIPVRYIDEKRTNRWLSLNRLQLPVGETRYGSIRKITYADGKVKIENSKNETPMQKALRDAGVIDSYGNIISKEQEFDTEFFDKKSDRDYSYDELISKPDMKITVVSDSIPNNRADVVAQAKKNAAKVGKFDSKTGSVSVCVEDIGTEVVLSKKGLVHSLDRRFQEIAPVTVQAGEIIKNSIKINELTPSKQEADASYVLVGIAQNANGELYIVRSVVNKFSNELTSMDVLYAINAKKRTAALNAPLVSTPNYRSAISISKLLDYVNRFYPDVLPEDVLRHFGHTERPQGDLGESVLFSDRDTNSIFNTDIRHSDRITADMGDAERARILEKKKMKDIPVVENISEAIIQKLGNISSWDEINNLFGKNKNTLIQKLASEFGVFKSYENEDIALSFDFSNNNYRESYHKQKTNYEQFAKMFSVFDDVIKNAVGIEIHKREDYKPDVTLKNVYVLISAFEDGDFIIPVKLEVKEFKDKQNTLYVAISLQAIKKTEVSKQGTTENGVAQNSRSVNIKVADLMQKVNPLDTNFTKYFPKELLTEEQLRALNTSEDVKFSDRDSEGNKLSAEQIEFFKDSKVRDENGILKVMYHGSPNAGFHEFNTRFSDDKRSFFFTDSVSTAESYSGTSEVYTAKTFKTEDDFNNFFAEIGAEDYEVIEENGKFVLYDDGDEVATSETGKELYEEFVYYTGLGQGSANYKGYLNLKTPLIIDANNVNWSAIKVPKELQKDMHIPYANTRQFSEFAKAKGYDGVIINGVYDNGGYSSGLIKPTTVAIAFESNQIKSVANTNPISDPDIRYSFRNSKSKMANDSLSPYNDELAQFIESRGDYIIDSFEKLEQLVNITFDNPHLKATAYFGVINAETLSKIKNSIPNLPKAGKEILFKEGKDYSIATTLDSIRHIVDEKKLNRLDVIDYLDRLADTIVEFDSVAFDYYTDSFKKKSAGLLFKKSFPDGVLISFDVVSQKKRSLVLQSLYLDSADYKKKKSAETLLMQNNLSHTSEMGVGQTSAKSIYQEDTKSQELSSNLFSDRDTNSTSVRSLLANSLEGVAQNEIEKNKLKEYKSKIALMDAEQKKLTELRAEIKELSFAKGKRDKKKIIKLQDEATRAANRINTYDRQLLSLEATKPLQNVLNREKELAKKKQMQKDAEYLKAYKEKVAREKSETVEHYRMSRKKAIEGRSKTKIRHRIKKVVGDLNQMLLKGTKDRHIMLGLQKVVASALDAINMDTVGADERVAKYNALIAKESDPDIIASLTETRDRIQNQGDKMSEKLSALKDAYSEIKNSPDDMTSSQYDGVIFDKMESVQKIVGNTPLRDMTLEQLQEVYELYTMVLTTVRDSNKAFADDIKITRIQLGSNTFREIKDNHKTRTHISDKRISAEKFGWQNMKPMTAMKTIGSDTLRKLWNNILYGQEVFAKDYDDAVRFAKATKEKYGYHAWNLKKMYSFNTKSGKTMKISLEQMMSIYAYSKRAQADDHIEKGGLVLNENVIEIKNKFGITTEVRVNDSTAYRLSKNQVGEIVETLEKIAPGAKSFVDEMQRYLSETMGAKGNEVSRKMYGVNLFKETNYFPLKSSKEFMETANTKLKGDVKIKDKGMTKSVIEHASNPIVLENFLDVWGNHVNEMSLYHSLVLPMEDFSRTLNYCCRADDRTSADAESVKTALHDVFGDNAENYLNNLIKHINGGVLRDSTTGMTNKLIGKYKRAKVMASGSVIVQQPTAIIRAMGIIEPKYFVAQNFNHKATWEELKKYCPTAVIKETGSFDTNMGKTIVEMVKDDGKFRFDDAITKAPAYMDEAGWNMIWRALKKKISSEQGLSGEELLKVCGKEMTIIINETQVYDSVLSRSELMRSNDVVNKMATSFMAEPTTVANMIYGAALDFKRGKKSLARKTVAAVISSIVVNGLVSSIIYALRDDDEDETFLEKYLQASTSEIVDGLNPITWIPYLKDIWSIFQGYDIARTDMSLFADVADAMNKFGKLFDNDAYEDMSDDKIKEYIYNNSFPLVGSVCNLFGIPVENVVRDIKAIFRKDNLPMSQTTREGTKSAIKEGFLNTMPKMITNLVGEDTKEDKLYDAIISGDQVQIERIKSQYDDQNALNIAIRKAIRENDSRITEAAQERFNGNFSEYASIVREIIAEKHFSQDLIVGAVNAELNDIKQKSEKDSATETDDLAEDEAISIYSAWDVNMAFENGDTATALQIISNIVAVKTENYINEGYNKVEAEKKAKSAIRSSMTSYWKPLYIKAYKRGDNEELKRIRNILNNSRLYSNANTVVKTIQKWIKESI